MPLGIYISVPFCRTKCSYCNFASDVFSRAVFHRYIDRVCEDIKAANDIAERMGGHFDRGIDSIYLGGGTPTVLDSEDLRRLFATISQNFDIPTGCEVTVECAPGTLDAKILETLVSCGVNRVSLGVQSFVDREAAAVGRLHQRVTVHEDIARLRGAGIDNINVDLIAGLPHQSIESWRVSLNELISCDVPHASVYMLEVDDDSRLGRELIAGGTRYHAHFVPDEDLTAEMYESACERLNAEGVAQYEISNFARPGFESSHNLKYWTRQPYLGFGVDAHSMLPVLDPETDAVRFSTPDSLEKFVASPGAFDCTPVPHRAALEESFFLGLRLTRGIETKLLREKFGAGALGEVETLLSECVTDGLIERDGSTARLTSRGRMLSNEVFERFIAVS